MFYLTKVNTCFFSYYRLFAKIYGFCGSFAQVVIVNSTWTKGHIDTIWHTKSEIVYPPCDTERLNVLPLKGRKDMIVSVAQFRPEKDHSMQLKALARLIEKYPQHKYVKLVLIGSSRNEGDANRIDNLRKEANALGIQVRLNDKEGMIRWTKLQAHIGSSAI